MNKAFLISILGILLAVVPCYPKQWTGTVVKEFDNADNWVALVTKMKDMKMSYGATVGAERILSYFSDLKSKEFSYQTLVDMADFGYPYNLRPVFTAGDLELSTHDNFSQSYNLYKATIDLDKNMPKWADNYFARVDKDNFSKYLFFKALEQFSNKKYDESLAFLDKALQGLKDPSQLSLTKKVSRTMARIYYEQGKYKEAFEIYQDYLLKLNPIENSDWLEAAWCLYRLGRFEESLGYLYNLEVAGPSENVNLEKYVIRALIYREKCGTEYTTSLAKSFEQDFGPTIEKIKLGESLKSLPMLKRIIPTTSDYNRNIKTTEDLIEEQKRIPQLPPEMHKLAEYLYSSEIKDLQKNKESFEDVALNDAARSLVIMGESLRFLQFDVVREKYNPDKVFAPPPPPMDSLVENTGDQKFILHWIQWGDYWRDERSLYHGILKNWCQ